MQPRVCLIPVVILFVALILPANIQAQSNTAVLTLEESTDGLSGWKSVQTIQVVPASSSAFYRMRIAMPSPSPTPTPTPMPTPTQSVGGIINSDTVWSDTSVIYAITSKVQIAYGTTLTISPGVRVQNGTVEVFGRLIVKGTAQNPALLSGVNILPGSQSRARNFEIILQHARITGGSVYSPTGNGIYGTLTMEDSVVEDVGSYMHIWYPTSTAIIRRNIFSNCGSGNDAWIDGGSGYGVDIVVENNVFKNCAPVVNWAAYSNAQMLVRYNTFLPANGATAVGFRLGYTSATMDARENYWGTTDETQIGTMIFDQNDDLGTSGVIPFKPFLTAPHPNTPVAP